MRTLRMSEALQAASFERRCSVEPQYLQIPHRRGQLDQRLPPIPSLGTRQSGPKKFHNLLQAY